jgi:hypothetical protein
MKGPWTYKVKKRKFALGDGSRGGETIILRFKRADGYQYDALEFCWYPPWRNALERANAKSIVDDLNRAFKERNATPHGAASRKHPALRRRVRRPQWEEMHKLLEKP